jgi:hypothetical protein
MYHPTIHLLQGPAGSGKTTYALEKMKEKKPDGRDKYLLLRHFGVGQVLRTVLEAVATERDIIFDPLSPLEDDEIASLHHGIVGFGVLDIKRFDATWFNKEDK